MAKTIEGGRAIAAACLLVGMLAGCATRTKPADLLRLSPESGARRAMQTRVFETADETELLSASAAVLQDLGFQVSESVREVGFLRATKERSARQYGQHIARTVLLIVSALGCIAGSDTIVYLPVDLHQQINASLVARRADAEGKREEVRVLFYRVVWKGDGSSAGTSIPPGEQRMEMIRDPVIYQQFFARLSKAVFLEPHKI